MSPYLIRHIIYNNLKARKWKLLQGKKKYAIINKRQMYSLPNGPEEPEWLWFFITAATSYYTIKLFRDFYKNK